VRFLGTMPAGQWNRPSRAECCTKVACVMQAGKGAICPLSASALRLNWSNRTP
jgi:hypothetical protein